MKNFYTLLLIAIFFPYLGFSQGIQVVKVNKTIRIGDKYELSIKNDGVVDLVFELETNSKGNNISIVNKSAMHAVAAAEMEHFRIHGNYAIGFEYGKSMGEEWVIDDENAIVMARNYGEHQDNFKGKGKRFVGTRHKMAGGDMYHYGWVEVEVNEDATTLTIVEYGFNTAHDDRKLFAGEKDVIDGIERNAFQSDFTILVNNQGLEINSIAKQEVTYQLFDLAGNLLQTQGVLNGKNLFSVTGLTKGVYLVNLQAANERLVQKVFIP